MLVQNIDLIYEVTNI